MDMLLQGDAGVASVTPQPKSRGALTLSDQVHGISYVLCHADLGVAVLEARCAFLPEIAAIVRSYMTIDWSTMKLPPHVRESAAADTVFGALSTFAQIPNSVPVTIPDRMHSHEYTVVRLEDVDAHESRPFYEWNSDGNGQNERAYCTFSFTHDPNGSSPVLKTAVADSEKGQCFVGDFNRFQDFEGHAKQHEYESSCKVPISSCPVMRTCWKLFEDVNAKRALAFQLLADPAAAIAEIRKKRVTSVYIEGDVVRPQPVNSIARVSSKPICFVPSSEGGMCVSILTVPISLRHADLIIEPTLAESCRAWIHRVEAVVHELLLSNEMEYGNETAAAGTNPAGSAGAAPVA